MRRSSQDKISICGINFYPAGKHAKQYLHPFVVEVDETVMHKAAELAKYQSAEQNYSVSPSPTNDTPPLAIGMVSHDFDLHEEVPVKFPAENGLGWWADVSSFVIELEITHPGWPPTKSYVAGYTDRPIPKDCQSIDPNTTLFINSVFDAQHYGDQIRVEGNQVLFDPYFLSVDGDNKQLLRPSDVFSRIEILNDPILKSGSLTFTDTRTMRSVTPCFSQYTQIDPTVWAEKMFTWYSRHVQAEMEMMGNSVRRRAMQSVRFTRDKHHMAHAFMMGIANVVDGTAAGGFPYGALSRLDPVGCQNVKFAPAPVPDSETDYMGWQHKGPRTRVANHLTHSVPATMAMHGIRQVQLTIDDAGADTITGAVGIAGSIGTETLAIFKRDLKTRVVDNITALYHTPFHLEGSFDLFASSLFTLGIDGQEPEPYASPTFANALFAPVIGADRAAVEQPAEAFQQIFQQINI
jgi:hypothetical protein